MPRTTFAAGYLAPTKWAEGWIACPCGYEGRPSEPIREWPSFGIWLGRCSVCDSHRAITPRRRAS
jgi:hypothetical protein